MPIYKDSAAPSVVKKITLDGQEHQVSKILLMDDAGDEHNIWRTKRLVRFMSYDGSLEYLHGWYSVGDVVTKPSVLPQRDAIETLTVQTTYTFVGWSTNPNASSGIDPDDVIALEDDNDITYYAAYSQLYKYKITFMTYDGSQIVETPTFYPSGVTVTPPAEPSRQSSISGLNYNPIGWSTSKDATSADTINVVGTSAVTYYAAYSMTRYLIDGKTTYGSFNSGGNYGESNWAGYTQSDTAHANDADGYVFLYQSVGGTAHTHGGSQTCKTGISLSEIKKYSTMTVKCYRYTSVKPNFGFGVGLWGVSNGITPVNAVIIKTLNPNATTAGTAETVSFDLSALKNQTTPATLYFGFGRVLQSTGSACSLVITEVKFTS